LAAESLGSDPERFIAGLNVTLLASLDREQGRAATLERSWIHQGSLVLKFAGVDTRTEAETLRGWYVCIPEEQRPQLEEGEIYLSDIVGCEVVTREVVTGEERRIGVVTGWQDLGGPVVLEVGDDLLIPYVPQICCEVDLTRRKIRVDLPEGLEDLNRK